MTSENATIVFQKTGQVNIEGRPRHEPQRGQILVKTSCTLISTGTELTVLSSNFPKDSQWNQYGKFPFIPGYNNVGKVVHTGEGVDKKWVGQRVATYGPHAQYTVTTPNSCRPIPDRVSDDQAVFFTIAEIVMNGVRRGQVKWGESVAVYGLGLLGQLAVRICHFAGARPVIGLDISQSRLGYLPDLPRVVGVNPSDNQWINRVKEVNRNRLVDVVFEVTGNPRVIPEEFKVLREQGRFVVLSSPWGKTTFDFHDLCNRPSYTIIGAHNMSHPSTATPQNPWTQKRHAELFFNLLADGSIDVNSLISHREDYRRAPELYKMLLENRSQAMGIVLKW